MQSSECLILKIIDINRIKRKSISITTFNKECSVISCRLSGSSCFYDKGNTLHAGEGDLLFVPKGATYRQETRQEDVVFIHIEIFGESEKNITVLNSENPQKTKELFLEIERLWNEKKANYIYHCTSLLYKLIAETGIALPKREDNYGIISRAVSYINEHYAKHDFSLDEAAERCGISRVYFNRLFKNQFGKTPISYINELRIKNAIFLLKSNNYTHSEIADMCGFEDVKYFYTVFKKVTGFTTSKFKIEEDRQVL